MHSIVVGSNLFPLLHMDSDAVLFSHLLYGKSQKHRFCVFSVMVTYLLCVSCARVCVCVALYIDQQQQDMTGCQIAKPPLILNSI